MIRYSDTLLRRASDTVATRCNHRRTFRLGVWLGAPPPKKRKLLIIDNILKNHHVAWLYIVIQSYIEIYYHHYPSSMLEV